MALPTFAEFQTACQSLVAAAPSCKAWRLEFAHADFQTVWQVKVWSGNTSTFEELRSATFAPDQLPPLLAHAAKVIREVETSSTDESKYAAVVKAELEAALRT